MHNVLGYANRIRTYEFRKGVFGVSFKVSDGRSGEKWTETVYMTEAMVKAFGASRRRIGDAGTINISDTGKRVPE